MTSQSEKWHETRKAKLDELFEGQKFDVVEEFHSDVPVTTVLGYKTKNGYYLSDGTDKIAVGKTLLKQIAEQYGAVELPEPKRRGRPKKQLLEQAEQWADRDMPNDAQQVTQAGPTYVNPNSDQSL